MEEVHDGLFKDFCFFPNILITFKIPPDSWVMLGGALGHPMWQQGRQQRVPFSTGFKTRAVHLTQGKARADEPEEPHLDSQEGQLRSISITIILSRRQDRESW